MTQAIGRLKRKGRPELERLKRRLEQAYENHNGEVEARVCEFRRFLTCEQANLWSEPISELVCVRLDETPALVQVAELGADREAVQGLTPGSFPAWNRTSRGRLTGKVF